MRVVACLAVLGTLSLAPAAVAVASAGSSPAAAGQVAVVQAVPGATVDVAIDGRAVSRGVDTGKVLGPYRLSPGEHQLDFTGSGGLAVATTVTVEPGASQDVVLHLPASVGGAPVVNSYLTPTTPIGPGKARVLVAHTATVAPADVVVDGATVFTNIANGEFATADVPAGAHVVALLPTGETSDPILGPLDVDLEAGTITMVYAIGNPADSSMSLVAHSAKLTSDGALAPDVIDTGSAGLVGGLAVRPFGPHLSSRGR